MPTLKWDVKNCLQQCSPMLFFNQTIKFSKTRIRRRRNVTLSEIQEAYKLLAKIITAYGDLYLPLVCAIAF